MWNTLLQAPKFVACFASHRYQYQRQGVQVRDRYHRKYIHQIQHSIRHTDQVATRHSLPHQQTARSIPVLTLLRALQLSLGLTLNNT